MQCCKSFEINHYQSATVSFSHSKVKSALKFTNGLLHIMIFAWVPHSC